MELEYRSTHYTISGFESLDFFSEHYYPDVENFGQARVPYDIRNDRIPFADNSVDNIYVSHVIEHIEPEFVRRLFFEAHRVLTKGGVLRVACPDGRFLMKVSQFKNSFWGWREGLLNSPAYSDPTGKWSQWDYLLRELSTPRYRRYKNAVEKLVLEQKAIRSWSFKRLQKEINENSYFRPEFPGDHISVWDYVSIRELGAELGFGHVIESKYQGYVSEVMQGNEFDRTHPQMSLYVDLVK